MKIRNILFGVVAVVVGIAVVGAIFVYKNRNLAEGSRTDGESADSTAAAVPVDHGPISVSFRKAQWGSGYVLMTTNTGSDSIRVTVEAAGKRGEKVLDPRETWELGHAEGVALASNDKAIVTAAGYAPREVVIAADKPVSADQLPALPIEVSKRNALLGSGQVLTMSNKSGAPLGVEIICERPTTAEKKIFKWDNWIGMKEIGHQEGWAFAIGDIITVSAPGYQPHRAKFE